MYCLAVRHCPFSHKDLHDSQGQAPRQAAGTVKDFNATLKSLSSQPSTLIPLRTKIVSMYPLLTPNLPLLIFSVRSRWSLKLSWMESCEVDWQKWHNAGERWSVYRATLKYCSAATHCSWGKRQIRDMRVSISRTSLSAQPSQTSWSTLDIASMHLATAVKQYNIHQYNIHPYTKQFFFFFCVPQLHLWCHHHFLGEIFAYVTFLIQPLK